MSLSKGLKPGEVALVGWQYAPYKVPAWLPDLIARNATKEAKRSRYVKRYNRHIVSGDRR